MVLMDQHYAHISDPHNGIRKVWHLDAFIYITSRVRAVVDTDYLDWLEARIRAKPDESGSEQRILSVIVCCNFTSRTIISAHASKHDGEKGKEEEEETE